MARAWSKELFEAILASSDDDDGDDAARLVFADWLSERGDPRGELIVIQSRLARGEASDELHDRESMLLTRHKRLWLREAGVASGMFRRGFLEVASLGSKAFLKGKDKLAETSVLRDLTFALVAPADIGEIANASVLGRVTRLELKAALKLGAGDAVRLAQEGAPNLGRVSELVFARHPIGDRGLAALLEALPRLRRLDVAECAIHELGEGSLERLEALDVSHNPIGASQVRRLAARGPNLVELRLWGTALAASDVGLLVTGLPRLRKLAIARAGIGQAEIAALGALPLEELVLVGNPLDKTAMRTLVEAPFMATLATLDIGSADAGRAGLEALARAAPPRLVDLRAKASGLGDASAVALSRSPLAKRLESLTLSDNRDIGDAGARALSAVEWPRLKNLELYGTSALSVETRRALRDRFGDRLVWSY